MLYPFFDKLKVGNLLLIGRLLLHEILNLTQCPDYRLIFASDYLKDSPVLLLEKRENIGFNNVADCERVVAFLRVPVCKGKVHDIVQINYLPGFIIRDLYYIFIENIVNNYNLLEFIILLLIFLHLLNKIHNQRDPVSVVFKLIRLNNEHLLL